MKFIYTPGNFIAIWLLWMVVGLLCRPLLPVDETRVVAIAWSMWTSGDSWLPLLNGVPQIQTPPLLAWLIESVWWLGGVNDWSVRLVAPLFGLANLYLTILLGRQLWPSNPRIAKFSPWLLVGSLIWVFWTTLALDDMLVCSSVLLGLIGLIRSARELCWRGWAILLFAAIAGCLVAGPIVLLWFLPTVCSAPRWSGYRYDRSWLLWYLGVFMVFATALGVLAGWAWLVMLQHPDLTLQQLVLGKWHTLILGQAMSHARPVWWYVTLLPVLLLPWIMWPPLWRAALNLQRLDAGLRICLLETVTALVFFSLLPGKQLHYLLPLFPLLALAATRLLVNDNADARTHDAWLLGSLFGGAALILLILPEVGVDAALIHGAGLSSMWDMLLDIPVAARLTLLVLSGLLIGWRPCSVLDATAGISLVMISLAVLVHMVFAQTRYEQFDFSPMADRLHALEVNGNAIAHGRGYHGEYIWLGRLRQPVDELWSRSALEQWLAAHPKGYVIAEYPVAEEAGMKGADFTQAYRMRQRVGLWSVEQLQGRPDVQDALAKVLY